MKKKILLVLITMLSLFIFGCTSAVVKKDTIKEITVEKDEAKELDIQLSASYGEVNIASDATGWVDGSINYNVSTLKPEITYKLTREKGKLSINQQNKRVKKISRGQIKNKWDLFLTNEVPVTLKLETGASDTSIDLRNMKLSKLNIESGVGRLVVDLSGSWEESFDVQIEMGVGESTIKLPKDVGVKLKTEKGIGAINVQGLMKQKENVYVNKSFETSNVIITIHAEVGVGEVNFTVKD